MRNKVTGALAPRDTTELGQKVATRWLRLIGMDVDARTGIDRQADWLRLRAEASGLGGRSADPASTDHTFPSE